MKHAIEIAWMLAFAALFSFWAWSASAQDFPGHGGFHQPDRPNFDRLSIEDGPFEGTAIVIYGNDTGKSSDAGTFTLTAPNGITVQVIIKINVDDDGRERITVLTGDEHTAWPVEADVSDGEDVVIQIMRPFS